MNQREAPTSPEEQALFFNLSLLGVTNAAAKSSVDLGRTSFRKPNPKALELVLYHLFAAVHGEQRAAKVRE